MVRTKAQMYKTARLTDSAMAHYGEEFLENDGFVAVEWRGVAFNAATGKTENLFLISSDGAEAIAFENALRSFCL